MRTKFKFAFYVVVWIILMGLFTSCTRAPVAAFFRDATVGGSYSNTVNLSFAEDSAYDEKFYDIMIKSNTDNLQLNYYQEFDETTAIILPQKDEWYSITTLTFESAQNPNIDFLSFKDKTSKNLIFESTTVANIDLKVVVGDKIEREGAEGFLLVNPQPISSIFSKELKEKE